MTENWNASFAIIVYRLGLRAGCNRQNVSISDFHIRNTKSYNCGSMDGKVERKFGDYGLPLFRGSYEASEIMIKDCNETIINDSMLRCDLPCFFNEEMNVELHGSDPKASANSSYHRCKKAMDHVWSVAGKPLSASKEGALFFDKMMREVETKAANYLASQHSNSKYSSSQIEDMPFIKPQGYSNKRTKSFYENTTSKRKKTSSEKPPGLNVVDAESCKPKGRPKKSQNLNNADAKSKNAIWFY